jgi:hypothetical protein
MPGLEVSDKPDDSPLVQLDEAAQRTRQSLRNFSLPLAYLPLRSPGQHFTINTEFVYLPEKPSPWWVVCLHMRPSPPQ